MSQFEIHGPNIKHFGMLNQLSGFREVDETNENQGEVIVSINPFYPHWMTSLFGLRSNMVLDMTVTAKKDSKCDDDDVDDDKSNGNADQSNKCTCCGNETQKRIVGGTVAQKHEYPWHIGIQHKFQDHPHCGGTIISSKYVITAAHCMQYSANEIEVLIAEHDTQDSDESKHFYKALVESVIVHEEYNAATINNDIALLKLKDAIEFSQNVYPAFLAIKEPQKDDSVIATGWGHTSYKGSVSNILREVDLTIKSREDCVLAFKNTFTLTANMICAEEKGKDACQGDSGGETLMLLYFHIISFTLKYCMLPGPLIKCNGEKATLVGLVSFGIGCASGYPGVYTNIANFIDWIKDNVEGEDVMILNKD